VPFSAVVVIAPETHRQASSHFVLAARGVVAQNLRCWPPVLEVVGLRVRATPSLPSVAGRCRDSNGQRQRWCVPTSSEYRRQWSRGTEVGDSSVPGRWNRQPAHHVTISRRCQHSSGVSGSCGSHYVSASVRR
jgi:hypothetical protein